MSAFAAEEKSETFIFNGTHAKSDTVVGDSFQLYAGHCSKDGWQVAERDGISITPNKSCLLITVVAEARLLVYVAMLLKLGERTFGRAS